MTKQEIFDKVAKHLLRQRKQAMDKNGNCQYRTDKGLRCAIGCLIPKRLYDSSIEYAGAWVFVDKRGFIAPDVEAPRSVLLDIGKSIGLRLSHESLLKALQILHDTTEPEDWRVGLCSVAQDHKLNQKVL